MATFESVKAKLEANDQGHLLTFYDSLSDDDKVKLLNQLDNLDVERANRIFKKANSGSAVPEASQLEPLPKDCFKSTIGQSEEQIKEWREIGLKAIAEGTVAVILMAGGQGTRLGSSAPKGCYDINLPSKKSLFQLQGERIRRLQVIAEQYRAPENTNEVIIPWYVMTSGPTRPATEAFFAKHRYFGLKKENVIFFEQGTLPAFTNEGKIFLESKSSVSVAPDGNGGIYAALRKEGHIHAYCVDNCLCRVADPIFLGYSIASKADCGVKVIPKTQPEEPVGVVCLRNKKFNVVEYSEIDKALSEQRDEDGKLSFRAANIANHYYTTEFLKSVESFESELDYHIAKKKIKHVTIPEGEFVAPTSSNGMKMELFVFDVFPFVKNMAVLEVDRKDEFSPLKNAPGTGVDCPETSRADILKQYVRFVEAAGGKVVKGETDTSDVPSLEISPLVTYAGEGLEELKDKTITTPLIINNDIDLKRAAGIDVGIIAPIVSKLRDLFANFGF
ncbi:nucleotide-diphospho-sugar transferase [Neocallimastix californiae]|uniref:UDP-N-acetylglucosamine diphosphorylase n=1 Tax=Neocallimastix californiae TaxID=1754190 RepID=A0A1Y2BY79_9FUNG|nr:nucleotide-diphospho-sugar transferase [Neocallimastix californiae]|eukprot:ORY39696.1 nucleotide-diphospho-sugar transferase [Neocallimastix californiae]